MPNLQEATWRAARWEGSGCEAKVTQPVLAVTRGCWDHQVGGMLYSASRVARWVVKLGQSAQRWRAEACGKEQWVQCATLLGWPLGAKSGPRCRRVGVEDAPARQMVRSSLSSGDKDLRHLVKVGWELASRSMRGAPSESKRVKGSLTKSRARACNRRAWAESSPLTQKVLSVQLPGCG